MDVWMDGSKEEDAHDLNATNRADQFESDTMLQISRNFGKESSFCTVITVVILCVTK